MPHGGEDRAARADAVGPVRASWAVLEVQGSLEFGGFRCGVSENRGTLVGDLFQGDSGMKGAPLYIYICPHVTVAEFCSVLRHESETATRRICAKVTSGQGDQSTQGLLTC